MVELIPKRKISRQGLKVFLVDAVSFLEKNITSFLIVASLMDGYMLTLSTDAIVTMYLFISNSSSLYFRSDDWTTETRLYVCWSGLRGPIGCSLLGGGIPTQNSGYGDTRLCPS